MPVSHARRALWLLAGSYALMWSAISITAGPGPATLVALTGRTEMAGAFFATFSIAAAVGGAVGGRLMDHLGRRPVLVASHIVAAAGYLVLGASVRAGGLWPFLFGIVLFALGTGAAYLTRLAAAESFPPERRARGMAMVLVGAAAGALMGPALLFTMGPLGADANVVWFTAALLAVAAAVTVSFAPVPPPVRPPPISAPASQNVPSVAPGKGSQTPLVAGFVALAATQAAMIGVMGVAGAALAQQGHGAQEMAGTLALHFVGMFALAPLVGILVDRWGRRPTILAGVVTLAIGSGVAALDSGLVSFVPGLFLVGLGWSFAYVSSTIVIADVAPAASRGRVMGLADLSSSLVSAIAVAAAGIWFAARGLPGLGMAAAALMVVPLAFVLAVREHRPGAYGVEDVSVG